VAIFRSGFNGGVSQPTVYSHARVAQGPTLYIAGQVPVTPNGSVPDGAEAQVRVVLDKIAALLAEHDLGWSAVVRLTYYLTDIDDLATLRRVLFEVLPEPRPTSTLLVVKGLVDKRFVVEIDAVADLGASGGTGT
jgi:2-iminobutanoate/2-iminopropanoate deaminase